LSERFLRFVCSTRRFRSQEFPGGLPSAAGARGLWGVRGMNLFAGPRCAWRVCRHDRMTAAVRAGFWRRRNWHDRVAILRFVEDIPCPPVASELEYLVSIEEPVGSQVSPVAGVGMRDWCFTPRSWTKFQARFPTPRLTPGPTPATTSSKMHTKKSSRAAHVSGPPIRFVTLIEHRYNGCHGD